MSRSGRQNGVTPALRAAELALWTGASLIVLTAYVAAGVWLTRETPTLPADDGPPIAIAIEFGDEPEAEITDENEMSPDQFDSAESMPAEEIETVEETPPEEPVEPEPEEIPEEVAEPEPESEPEPQPEPEPELIEEEVVEEEIDPLEQEIAEILDNVEVPLPSARPQPPEPRREVRRERPRQQQQPRRQQQQPASQAARQAQAQVRQSDRTAASQNVSGAASASEMARWQSRLMAHLERRKRYPSGARSRGERGVAQVRFTIDAAGNVVSVSLSRSSGHAELDNEVIAMVRRASPVPAPPPGANRTITAPVRFDVR